LSRHLRLFCSSQAYGPNTFGKGEGFRDQIYILGEEYKSSPYGRLFAIDSSKRKMHQVSGITGDASGSQGGVGGMPFDSFENVSLIRTYQNNTVALLLSMDGGSGNLKLYIGQKNKNKKGQVDTNDFLARNGLAYGSWFYLRGAIPDQTGQSKDGFFRSDPEGAMKSDKFEDIDFNPQNPKQVVLAGTCMTVVKFPRTINSEMSFVPFSFIFFRSILQKRNLASLYFNLISSFRMGIFSQVSTAVPTR